MASIGAFKATPSVQTRQVRLHDDGDDDLEDPILSYLVAITCLLISFNTEFAANSIQGLLTHAGLSKTFIGLIIVPMLGVDPLCIAMARKDKLDLSLALTLERCVQTALLVVPFVVLLGWWMGIAEMNMEFDTFPVLTIFSSVLIVAYLIADGKSTWYSLNPSRLWMTRFADSNRLTGVLLIKVYLLIALSAYYIK